jgi:guanylate kinase
MAHLNNTVVLLTGPAGVGKDSIIKELVRMDPVLKWIPKYTNRLLRVEEEGRRYATDVDLAEMERDGSVFVVTNKFGIKIAEPLLGIRNALKDGLTPITDYYIGDVSNFRVRVGVAVFNIYVTPPSFAELRRRLECVGRQSRFDEGISELLEVAAGKFLKDIDLRLVNNELKVTAQSIMLKIQT